MDEHGHAYFTAAKNLAGRASTAFACKGFTWSKPSRTSGPPIIITRGAEIVHDLAGAAGCLVELDLRGQ